MEEKLLKVVNASTKIDIQHGKNSIEGDKTIIDDTESALCEPIDNSIDSGASKIEITFKEKTLSNVLTKIIIKDDGRGMTEEDLVKFFGVGTETNVNKKSIGHYGFGANYALKFLAKKVIVRTKKKYQTIYKEATWVLDSENFQKYEVESKNCKDEDIDLSYTEIICDVHDDVNHIDLNLDFAINKKDQNTRFGRLKSRLSTRYKYYIENNNSYKDIKIIFNGTELEPIDPLYENSGVTKAWSENGFLTLNLTDEDGNPFTRKVNFKGFYVFDNGQKNYRSQYDRASGAGLPIDHQGCYLNFQGRYLTLGEGLWGGETANNNLNSGRIEFEFDKDCRLLFGLGANKSKPSFNLNRTNENSKLILEKIIKFRSWINDTYNDARAKKKEENSKSNIKKLQNEIISSLEDLDLDTLTPMDALNKISEWKKLMD